MSLGVLLGVFLPIGVLSFVGIFLYLLLGSIRRAAAREMVELEAEGIVVDSGSVSMTFRFDNFRGPAVYMGFGVRKGPGRCVLTRRRFTFVPRGRNRYGFSSMEREGLSRFRVDVAQGRLHLHSDNPPNASGSVDILISVSDPTTWVAALANAGAQTT